MRNLHANSSLDTTRSNPNIGYSYLAIIITLIFGGLVMFVLFGIGFRRYSGRLPAGGTCSASIAAACWRPTMDKNAAEKMVQWGELVHQEESFEAESRSELEELPRVAHLCFTSFDVIEARKRTVYH